MQEYISLGSICSVAYQLEQLNLRSCSYPFDWNKSPNFKSILNALNNDFSDYSTFYHFKNSDKYFLHDTIITKTSLAKNKYNIISCHDFNSSIPFNIQINNIENKYNRAIERFKTVLKSNKQIIFIRDNYKKITINDLILFDEVIKNKYYNNKYIFILICYNYNNINSKWIDKLKYNITNNNILSNNIKIIETNIEFDNWKRDNLNWHDILNNFT